MQQEVDEDSCECNTHQKEADMLMTGYIREETTNMDIYIPSDILGLYLLFYHIKPNCAEIPINLDKLIHGCFSNNIPRQFECTQQLRMMSSQANKPPIHEVIDSGVVPRLIRFCHHNKYPELQYEALWTLLNIASGPAECAKHIIDIGGHNVFIDLLQSPLYEIKEQALWALGNIAGDGPELKDLLLNDNILPNILEICSSKFDKKYVTNFCNVLQVNNDPIWQFDNLLGTCSWALSNLCRGSAAPTVQHLELLINCLRFLLGQALNMNDKISGANDKYTNDGGRDEIGKKNEIIVNIAWGFSYLTGFDEYQQQLVKRMGELGIMQQFVGLMDDKDQHVRHPVNRLIGNILTGSDEHTKKCLELGILSKYSSILSTSNVNAREQREICWSLSNICATDNANDKLCILKENLFEILIDYVENTNYETSKEALWAISNATTKCDANIINHLVKCGVQNALYAFLRKYESYFATKGKNKILLVALECIENILIVGVQNTSFMGVNKFGDLFEESGIVTFIEDLQVDENIDDEVYEKCVGIIKIYFHGQPEPDQESL